MRTTQPANFIISSPAIILFVFVLLLGRFPLWILLLLIYSQAPHMNMAAFIAFAFAIVLARGILYAYENQRSIASGSFIFIWRHMLKPSIMLVILYLGLIGLMLAFPNGAKSAQVMSLLALLLLIATFILHIKEPKTRPARQRTVLERDAALQLTLVLMWLYVFFFPDGFAVAAIMLFIIYVMEFAATYRPEYSDIK